MRLLYTKPALRDLSQGSRIAFVRQLRLMSQHTVADKLGLQHDNKRRIMTRYEKGDRNPKDDRTLELAKILNVEFNAIKKYDFEPNSKIKIYGKRYIGGNNMAYPHVTLPDELDRRIKDYALNYEY